MKHAMMNFVPCRAVFQTLVVNMTRVVWMAVLLLAVAAGGWSQITSPVTEINLSRSIKEGVFVTHPAATRIAAVAIQNRSVQPISTTGLDAIIAKLLRQQALDAVTLAFEPSADVEHQARLASCGYILYTDIAEVGKSVRTQLGSIMRMFGAKTMPAPESYVAVVEFRLFAMDEVLPRISTMTSGKTGRFSVDQRSLALRSDGAGATAEPEEDSDRNPRLRAQRLALVAALERVARTVRITIETPRPIF
jgi:hypothetical protein